MGGTVLIAQCKGANDQKGQIEVVGTLFTLTFIIAFLVTVIGLLIYRPLFNALKVPPESVQDAGEYMKIICYGTVFVFGYNAVCSIMKGFGDSKSPLYFIIIATVFNIILDVILVGLFHIGTKGAAYATILSQAISFIISIIHLKRKNFVFDFKVKHFTLNHDKMIAILKVGLPTAIQMIVVNISYLLVTGMLNHFGVSVAAASGIGLKITTFAGMPCWAIGQAVTAMSGQNIGACKIDRVRKTTQAGLKLNLLITFIVTVMVQLLAEPIIKLFSPDSFEVISDGIFYLRICCGINSLIYAAMYTFDSFAIGIGNAKIAMVNALLDAVIVRLSLSWLLAFTFRLEFTGIYIGQALSPVLPAIVGFLYFNSKNWESTHLIARNENELSSL